MIPVPVHLQFSHIQHIQHIQQQRYFGKGLQPRRHGKKYGYTNDEVKLQICYSDYDLQWDDDENNHRYDMETQDMTFAKVKFSLSDIKESLEEIFDGARHLQYYDNTGSTKTTKPQWRPLKDLNTPSMQVYRGGKKILKVRVPEYYDDTPMNPDDMNDDEYEYEEGDDDDFGEDEDGNPLPKKKKRKGVFPNGGRHIQFSDDVIQLVTTIKSLVTTLKENNYVRADGIIYGENDYTLIIYAMMHTETNEKILTKEFVLQQATSNSNKNTDLSRILLAVPGSLDHIVKSLHYDLLWEHERRPKRLHNGYRRW